MARFATQALCVTVLLLAGCGGGRSADAPSDEAATEDTSSSDTTVAGKTEPTVAVPEGAPPRKLVIKDIEVGKGPPARVGDFVTVEYNGLLWNGKTFSNSWTYPEPPTFELGGKRLEYGLDLGIRGMRAGGRREVIVPSTMLYWPGEQHDPLGRENTLVFITDLIAIR